MWRSHARPALKPDDYPTAESLIRQWSVVEAHVRQFLHRLHDDDLRRAIEFNLSLTGKTIQFPLDVPLPIGLIKRIVKARVAEVQGKKRR